MTPHDLLSSALLGILLFGQFLVVLGFIGMAMCAIIVGFIVDDIWRTIRIKKERRAGNRSI